jgi:hypothetical protein
VIHYATHARAALIKLLVMLKWKQVDVDKVLPDGGKVGKLSLATVSFEFRSTTTSCLTKRRRGVMRSQSFLS